MKALFVVIGAFLCIHSTLSQGTSTGGGTAGTSTSQVGTIPAGLSDSDILPDLPPEEDDPQTVAAGGARGAEDASSYELTSGEENSLKGRDWRVYWAYRYCRRPSWRRNTPRCKCFLSWYRTCYRPFRPHPLCSCVTHYCNWWF